MRSPRPGSTVTLTRSRSNDLPVRRAVGDRRLLHVELRRRHRPKRAGMVALMLRRVPLFLTAVGGLQGVGGRQEGGPQEYGVLC